MGNIIRLEKWIAVSKEKDEKTPCLDRADELSLLRDELTFAFGQLESVREGLKTVLETAKMPENGECA